ncbi:uncharacterized protein LOC113777162 [Coffea eugenioides]|uniref:uncharacterized protein LOC113777162 n=1 Tax=Coffea eugenioides TaxID=49369 RepID=UPI000F60BD3D|nr:uncharacterized protein LOC113777162 [Coffea eugenioides]
MNNQYPNWRLVFDGVSNLLKAGIGVVLMSPERKHYLATAMLRFPYTSNMAEYKACFFELKIALEMEIKDLIAFSDFDLLMHQMFKWNLESRHIPHTSNALADVLATLYSMIQYPDDCDIKEFIKIRSYPPGTDSVAKGSLRKMSYRFFLNEEILYKKISDLGFLRCIDEEETDYMKLWTTHE